MPKKKKIRRRPYGQGSLFYRDDGRVGWSWQHAGVRHQGSEKDEASAEKVLNATIAYVLKGATPKAEPGEQTFSALLDRWMELIVKPWRRRRTSEGYESVIRLHIKPALGEKKCRELTREHIQAFINTFSKHTFRGQVISGGTVQEAHKALSGAMKAGVQWGWIAENVARGVELPPVRPPKIDPLTEAELTNLLRVMANETHALAFALAALMGLRAYEIVSLRRGDFTTDFSRVQILGYEEDGERHTKTPHSKRTLNVPLPLRPLLAAHCEAIQRRREKAEEWKAGDHLFIGRFGQPLTVTGLSQAFLAAIRRHRLRRIRFHDLRHSYASLLLLRGIQVHVVAKLLGHSSPTITMRVYAHVLKSQEEDASETLSDLVPDTGVEETAAGEDATREYYRRGN